MRDKINASREALQQALDAGGEEIRAAIARLERMDSELADVEQKVAGQVGVGC